MFDYWKVEFYEILKLSWPMGEIIMSETNGVYSQRSGIWGLSENGGYRKWQNLNRENDDKP